MTKDIVLKSSLEAEIACLNTYEETLRKEEYELKTSLEKNKLQIMANQAAIHGVMKLSHEKCNEWRENEGLKRIKSGRNYIWGEYDG
jgi:aspartate/tyrosine/aromatic aminotransferase